MNVVFVVALDLLLTVGAIIFQLVLVIVKAIHWMNVMFVGETTLHVQIV